MHTKAQEAEVPRFSLAERERRWRWVRQLMERDGLDVIVASSTGGLPGECSLPYRHWW